MDEPKFNTQGATSLEVDGDTLTPGYKYKPIQDWIIHPLPETKKNPLPTYKWDNDKFMKKADEYAQQAKKAERNRLIDADSATRKTFPMAAGLLDYFPDALAAVAAHSKKAGDKHHPGEPMHWERGKSKDHADCIIRHLVNRGGFDGDDRESTALAWRALALLQEELEEAYGLAKPRNAT